MNAKTQSILSYLGILWLVAFFGGKAQRSALSNYHLKQGFGLLLTALIVNIVSYVLISLVPALSIIISVIGLLFLILMVFGIINAVNEVKRPLPLLGKLFEDKFSFIEQ
ncbi:DUF4870 domain-containing protein [Sphingobacterium bambusae]|uniref:DUF4870 domain-containing protein n=1 Tax=Sphingobacterium bambusae TaxID=662858 RepID=A0ABW6BB24_9SPHI|nr:DUF4870 domain-containing protein [Sphingobacterium bambusae]WPL48761.1 DUF4870 domain-containing protein [Sphingobacterium bambusae]